MRLHNKTMTLVCLAAFSATDKKVTTMTEQEFYDKYEEHISKATSMAKLAEMAGVQPNTLYNAKMEFPDAYQRIQHQVMENRHNMWANDILDTLRRNIKGCTQKAELLRKVGMNYDHYYKVIRTRPEIDIEVSRTLMAERRRVKKEQFLRDIEPHIDYAMSVRDLLKKAGQTNYMWSTVVKKGSDLYNRCMDSFSMNRIELNREEMKKRFEVTPEQRERESFNSWGDWFYEMNAA